MVKTRAAQLSITCSLVGKREMKKLDQGKCPTFVSKVADLSPESLLLAPPYSASPLELPYVMMSYSV
jgi:hypothetical protein